MSTTEHAENLNIDPYLNISSYKTHGNKIRLHDHTLVYVCGKVHSKNGVIIIPDTLGWNTGRIRNLCDFFGDNGIYAVIPNFSSKGIEGETESFMSSSSIGDWYKSRTFGGNIKPVIRAIVEFMKNQGVEKIALLGFAWGSWVTVNLLASDLAEDFYCAALSSPTIDLEEKVYGGSLPELLARVTRPILFMPTQGDTEHYNTYLKLLKSTSTVIEYQTTEANFLLRGNGDDQSIAQAIQKSVIEIFTFFQKNFLLSVRIESNEIMKEGSGAGSTMSYTPKGNDGEMKDQISETPGKVIGDSSEGKGLEMTPDDDHSLSLAVKLGEVKETSRDDTKLSESPSPLEHKEDK